MVRAKSRESCFLRVRCDGCGSEQAVFSHTSSVVKCLVCSKTLATPRGGKAEIEATILGIME